MNKGLSAQEAHSIAAAIATQMPTIRTQVELAALHMDALPADDRRYRVRCTTLTWHYSITEREHYDALRPALRKDGVTT